MTGTTRQGLTAAERQMLTIGAGGGGGWQPETPTQWKMARELRMRGLLDGPTERTRFVTTGAGCGALGEATDGD